ncbi:MAG: hypothetical protein AAGM84_02870 [Pseudomonadota bacterium]
MSIRSSAFVVLALSAGSAAAQDTSGAPLSAIDWLRQQTPPAAIAPVTQEPAVTGSATVPAVTVTPLEGAAARQVGLVPGDVTGLPATLWKGADGLQTAARIDRMGVPMLPAAQALFYTVLLAETDPPTTGAAALVLARIDALMRMGALDPALALSHQSGPPTTKAAFERLFDAALLAGEEAQACAVLQQARPPLADYREQVFCAARAGDWDTAALLLGTASALGDLSEAEANLLAQFLDPELVEGDPAIPARPDPLSVRMLEAVGTPVSTTTLPRAFANLDLRDVAGWKAQLSAAERLAETGAIDANRLFGIITDRQPAASGGIWDRTRSIQRFDTALRTGSSDAIAKTLPDALTAARAARMAVPVAGLFADRLLQSGAAGSAPAYELILLSPRYEEAATRFPEQAADRPLLGALAAGDTATISELQDPLQDAVRRAFGQDAPAPDARLIEMARGDALGPALLDVLTQLDRGARGDLQTLSRALVTLRVLGLEDTARRAALQVLLMERQT